MTPKMQRFVEGILLDPDNARQAAINAGYSEKGADQTASRLLKNVKVKRALAEARKARSERTEIEADAVLARWWAIATADPNELIEYRRVCCRGCYGGDITDRTRPIDPRMKPDKDCYFCFGEGIGESHAKDTRRLKGSARLLYAGVRETKEGIEIKMHDQPAALMAVAKHLGMLVEKREVSGPNGGPIQNEHTGTITVTDRIEALATAFLGAASRQSESDLSGNDSGKPVGA